MGGGVAVQAQGGIAHALGQLAADLAHHRVEIDVLVVVAHGGLGRGGEDRFGQLFGLAQAVGQGDAADLAGALVVLPAAADQVTAGDRFHRHRLESAGHHRALGVQRRIGPCRQHRRHVDTGEVVGHQVCGLAEPEIGDLAQHLALAGNRVGQHHIEGRQAVGGDHQQVAIGRFGRGSGSGQGGGGDAFARQVEYVTHLAAVAQRQAGQVGLEQGRGQRKSPGQGRARSG